MNEKFKNIRAKYFPLAIRDEYEVISSEEKTVTQFLRENFSSVFPRENESGHQGTLLTAPERKLIIAELSEKTGYNSLHKEHFLFLKSGEPVGWSTGETMDFMTYYMRNTGILPEHQHRGLYPIFLQTLTKYLEEIGYERLSSQHSPDNSRMLITKLKAGFIVTGLDLDERWGSLVRLTNFLKNDRAKAFSNCFGHGFNRTNNQKELSRL
jgi:hypothetical protein